jgi:hypothetical protein
VPAAGWKVETGRVYFTRMILTEIYPGDILEKMRSLP